MNQNPNSKPIPAAGDAPEPPPMNRFDVRLYWGIIFHRKWLILGCAAMFLAVAAFQLRRTTPAYSSTATILYGAPARKITLGADDAYAGQVRDAQEIQTQIGVIKSPKVTRRVIEALGLLEAEQPSKEESPAPAADLSPVAMIRKIVDRGVRRFEEYVAPHKPEPVDPETARMQAAIASLEGRMKIRQQPNTKLIDVIITDSDPRRAALVANEICDQYIQMLNEEKTDSYAYAIRWVKEQTDEAKRRLEEAEKRLYSDEGQFDMRVMEQKLEIASGSMKALSEQIQTLKQKIALAEASNEGKGAESIRQILLARDPDYAASVKRLKEMELKRVAMAAEFKPEFGELSRLDRELGALRGQIKKAEEDLLKSARGEAELARLEITRLTPLLNEQEELVQQIQEEMIQFRVLQRDVDSANEFYKILLDQSKEVSAKAQVEPTTISVVARAKISETPVSPVVMKTMNQFGLFGLALGVALALLLHQMDRSVKDAQQVEALTGLSPLATIPHMDEGRVKGLLGKGKGDRTDLVVLTRPKSIPAEAFRYLRTSLQYSTAGRPPQVILVTSAMPREGKSTISSNLALAFASRGQKTLLIDADLKEPTLHKSFDVFRSPGLSEILTGQERPETVIQSMGIDNFGLLPAGRSSPSPVDLLESATMREFMLKMRKVYDVIVLDSAPLMEIADSLVLAKVADGTCIVVNRGKTPIEALIKGAMNLKRVNINALGVIYNSKHKLTGPAVQYGYGYGYGYGGYGYGGYGYGAHDEDEEEGPKVAVNGKADAAAKS